MGQHPDAPLHPMGTATQWGKQPNGSVIQGSTQRVIGANPMGEGIPRLIDPMGQKGLGSGDL